MNRQDILAEQDRDGWEADQATIDLAWHLRRNTLIAQATRLNAKD